MLFKKNIIKIKEVSNIVQFDSLGYSLVLCTMNDNSQK